jgi:uroporphyrin-III C-methyltransferase/precorrin-2 dehydrogenase/sirohydrochlorin ferrochelatase
METLPIFLKVHQQPCVVVGGGEVAVRKVTMLLKAGAQISVVSPDCHAELLELVEAQKISWRQKHYQVEDIQDCLLVVAATDDEPLNAQISQQAKQLGILVNVVDAPELCSFTMPAIIDRSPLVIAISSNGAAPVLARQLRARLETMIPASYGMLAQFARSFRDRVKQAFDSGQQRRIFWEQILQGPIAEMVMGGQRQRAEQMMQQAIQQQQPPQGEVYLVGGGPGDPDLLTFRALRLMQQCDVCVYDKLVSKEVLEMVRRDAELIYVGKQRDQHTLPQQQINQLLVDLAQAGKRVLRLKGGDPFIFGRGGEEIETLMENQVAFQVVPGISAANGVSSYAGIPLTHRDYAQTCVFTTGHLKTQHEQQQVDLDWPTLVRPQQTVVIYMGLVGLPYICQQLMEHGLPATHPAAVVQQGTTSKQRVVSSDLAHLAQQVQAAGLKPPCLIIVGEVVKLREKLAWFQPSE